MICQYQYRANKHLIKLWELTFNFLSFTIGGNADREEIWKMNLDEPKYSNSYLHDAAKHILAQKSKFSRWLESDSPATVANALLLLCLKENRMLHSQIQGRLDDFRQTGGFSENES